MHLAQLIPESRVFPDLPVRDKRETLLQLATVFADSVDHLDRDEIFKIFWERENLGSTGIGQGIAIPHGRVRGLLTPLAILARCVEGIDFDAMDGQPVHLLVALLSPTGSNKAHLEALSMISRLLRLPKKRRELMSAPDQSAMFQAMLAEKID